MGTAICECVMPHSLLWHRAGWMPSLSMLSGMEEAGAWIYAFLCMCVCVCVKDFRGLPLQRDRDSH